MGPSADVFGLVAYSGPARGPLGEGFASWLANYLDEVQNGPSLGEIVVALSSGNMEGLPEAIRQGEAGGGWKKAGVKAGLSWFERVAYGLLLKLQLKRIGELGFELTSACKTPEAIQRFYEILKPLGKERLIPSTDPVALGGYVVKVTHNEATKTLFVSLVTGKGKTVFEIPRENALMFFKQSDAFVESSGVRAAAGSVSPHSVVNEVCDRTVGEQIEAALKRDPEGAGRVWTEILGLHAVRKRREQVQSDRLAVNIWPTSVERLLGLDVTFVISGRWTVWQVDPRDVVGFGAAVRRFRETFSGTAATPAVHAEAGGTAGKVVSIRSATPKPRGGAPLVEGIPRELHELPQMLSLRELEAQGKTAAIAILRELQDLKPTAISADLKLSAEATHVYISELQSQPGRSNTQMLPAVTIWIVALPKRVPNLVFDDQPKLAELFAWLTMK
jgi:hypothetical protein